MINLFDFSEDFFKRWEIYHPILLTKIVVSDYHG